MNPVSRFHQLNQGVRVGEKEGRQKPAGKILICINHQVQQCFRRNKCPFAHDVNELAPEIRARMKVVPCHDGEVCEKVKVHACTYFHSESLSEKEVTLQTT